MTLREKRMPAYKAFIAVYDFGLNDLPGERWLPIPDFDDYHCSTFARVKSFKENKPRIMRPTLNTSGWLLVFTKTASTNRFKFIVLLQNYSFRIPIIHRKLTTCTAKLTKTRAAPFTKRINQKLLTINATKSADVITKAA